MRSIFVLLLLCGSIQAFAGDWRDVKRSCGERASLHSGVHWLEQCIEDLATLHPVHPAIRTIAPGTGVGLGGGTGTIIRRGRTEYIPAAVLVRSTDGSTFAQAGITIAVPPFSFVRVTDDGTQVIDTEDQGYHDSRSSVLPKDREPHTRITLVRDYWQIDSKLSISMDFHWLDARRQDFYGLGPLSGRTGQALYGFRNTGASFALNDPVTTWAEAGLEAEFIHPEVRQVLNAGHPSIEQAYTEATAPGLTSNPDTLRFEPYFRFRLPVKNYHLRETEFKLGYGFYHDLDSSRFSFRRLHASFRSEQDIRLPNKHMVHERSAFANFACAVLRSRKHCTAGTISLVADVSASYTGAGSTVPFYLDETLGGADIHGNDTLRGYVDNRFRGPDRMFFQAEYRHHVWGPLGFLSFAESGKVAETPSDLSLEHMRHDYGLGMYISAANRIIFRGYIGFGTREPLRPNGKFGSVL